MQSDLNGTFEKCLEVRIYTVQAYLSDKDKAIVKAISRKRMEKLGNNQMYLKLHRKENKFGLIRNISYFFDDKGRILNDTVVLQYLVNKEVCGDVLEVTYKVRNHGNAKPTVLQFWFLSNKEKHLR